jgi:AraC-like DNA-binding protein
MEFLDLGSRLFVVAELMVFVAVLLRFFGPGVVGGLGALYAFGVAGYLLCPPVIRQTENLALEIGVLAGCLGVGVYFWLFSRALFVERFRPGLRHAAAVLSVLGLAYLSHYVPDLPDRLLGLGPESPAAQFYRRLTQILGLAFVVLALAQAELGKADDLVEARRRFRDLLVVISGAYILAISIAEIFFAERTAAAWLEFANVTGILIVVTAFLIYLIRIGPSFSRKSAVFEARDEQAAEHEAELLRLMEQEHAYRQEGLTIARLAERLGLQEYRLRRLINGGLGYRNFNDFLNRYRIAETRARLADPAEARLPVLTIALEAGFRSIGPFNRAFKDLTGMTPTAYRQTKLAERASQPGQS